MNEEDSDSDFGDWDRDNWRDSETTAEVKNAKSAVAGVRDALHSADWRVSPTRPPYIWQTRTLTNFSPFLAIEL